MRIGFPKKVSPAIDQSCQLYWKMDDVENDGPELWDADAAVFTSGTYSWIAYGTNTIANVGNALQITYVDNAAGAAVNLNNAADLSSDLTVGQMYELSFTASSTGGSGAITMHYYSGTALSNSFGTPTGTPTTYKVSFRPTSTTGAYLRFAAMDAGSVLTIDNLSFHRTTDIKDWSGNGVTGQCVSTPTFGLGGINHNSTGFDNDNSVYVYHPTFNSLTTLADSQTISVWIYVDAYPAASYNAGITGNAYRNAIHINPSGYLTYGIRDSGTNSNAAGSLSPIPLSTWTHFVGTYDTQYVRSYVNGNLNQQIAKTISALRATQAFGVAAALGMSGNFQRFTGRICELRYYNRAFSQSEIKKLYMAGR